MLRADVTEESPTNDRLLEQFEVHGVPTIILYDRQGVEVDRVVGFVDARRLSALMRAAAGSSSPSDRESSPNVGI
jgi:thiol:disulfide interchange protein